MKEVRPNLACPRSLFRFYVRSLGYLFCNCTIPLHNSGKVFRGTANWGDRHRRKDPLDKFWIREELRNFRIEPLYYWFRSARWHCNAHPTGQGQLKAGLFKGWNVRKQRGAVSGYDCKYLDFAGLSQRPHYARCVKRDLDLTGNQTLHRLPYSFVWHMCERSAGHALQPRHIKVRKAADPPRAPVELPRLGFAEFGEFPYRIYRYRRIHDKG